MKVQNGQPRKTQWFLGMQISQMKDCVTLDPENYIETVIEKVCMQDSNPSQTPTENNLKLVNATEDEQLTDETFNRSVVGSLLLHSKAN